MRLRDVLHRLSDDRGASAVTVAVMAVVLLGLAAIAVDAGAIYSERRGLQTAADAAALAGVQELPGDPNAALAVADEYAHLNTAVAADLTYVVSSTYATNDTLMAQVVDPARTMYLARFLGIETKTVGAHAKAVVSSPSAYGASVMPFGIMSKEPSGTAAFGYEFNEPVTLKQPAKLGESGNFQFLALTDPPLGHYGAVDITNALQNGGVPNPVYIDTLYFTKTGVNGKQVSNSMNTWIGGDTCSFSDVARLNDDGTVDLLDRDCHRVIICPIIVDPGPPVVYNWYDLNGTSRPVLIIGFSYFYVEGVGTTGNDCWISGRFIRPVGAEDAIDWGPIDPYGAVGYRLVE